MKSLKRSWWCQECGCGWNESLGSSTEKEGSEGVSTCYCFNCKAITKYDWRIIENTDPDEELDPPAIHCHYCEELKPNEVMNVNFENYSHPVCDYCLEVKNAMDLTNPDLIEVGQFDADELQYIRETESVRQLVTEGRIGVQYCGEDCGTLWVARSDSEAFKAVGNIIK